MKQHITNEQFFSLSEKAIEKFEKWAIDKGYKGEKVTIGILIEFLTEHQMVSINQHPDGWEVYLHDGKDPWGNDLCDALWEACKIILEK